MTARLSFPRTYGAALAALALALGAALAASAWAAHEGERAWVFLLAVPVPMILAAAAAMVYRRRQGGTSSGPPAAPTPAADEPGVYVETTSLYVAIYDEASPANVPGFFQRELEAARQEARAHGLEPGDELFLFNRRLIDGARRGDLLAWTLLFDGVFRAVVAVGPPWPPDADLSPVEDTGGLSPVADLVCPSGRLVLTCLSRLGQGRPPVVTVEPDTYRVVVVQDDEQEMAHTFLESRDAYPEGDGPDWRVTLRRIPGTGV